MRNFARILSVSVIIAMLFTVGGCSALTKKITDEAKTKISEQIKDAVDKTEASGDEDETEDTQEADNTKAADDEDNNNDSTAITTSDGKSMDWPSDYMGDIKPVSCKITAVYTQDSGGSIAFEGMERKEADNYLDDFASMGYKDGFVTEDEDGILFTKTNKAGDTIIFSYAPDGTGVMSYTPAESN